MHSLFLVFLTTMASPASGAALDLDVGLAQPILLAGQKNIARLRISLLGGQAAPPNQRAAVNICLALDRSGSMQGEKIAHARDGAIAALDRLSGADIVSVVAYDDVVQVLVPATRVSERRRIVEGIRRLQPGGSTALFAGVVKCAEQVRRFGDRNHVNRIILLSDGMANVGPSSPAELGALGARLMEEGISVATVGLGNGYNEDLMTELAVRSDGGHLFVENASDLEGFLDGELAAVTTIVARDVDVKVRCREGVRPLRVLGRPADITGGLVTAPFAKIYARRQHYFVIDLEVPPGAAGSERDLATVDVSFMDLLSQHTGTRSQPVRARFTTRAQEVDAQANQKIVAELNLINDNASTARALDLLNKGDMQGAQRVMRQNATDLERAAVATKDQRLILRSQRARDQAETVDKTPRESSLKHFKKQINDDPLEGIKL